VCFAPAMARLRASTGGGMAASAQVEVFPHTHTFMETRSAALIRWGWMTLSVCSIRQCVECRAAALIGKSSPLFPEIGGESDPPPLGRKRVHELTDC
jgi:hypothetical protein